MTQLVNMPPDIIFSTAIDDLYDEAKQWLDGEPLATQAQADVVGQIMARLRTLRKDADAARKVEKKPHDDAAKAVQDKWNPLLTKADRAIAAAQRPITDWLARMEAERIERERIARADADRLAREATAMARDTLAGAEAHDAALDAVKAAERAVARVGKASVSVAGDGRAVSLRTYSETTLTDAAATLRWMRENRPDALKDALLSLAKAEPIDIRRTIPGVTITEQKRAA